MNRKTALVLILTFAVAMLFVVTAVAAPTNLGSDACKMCHKVQHESWAKSKHATGTPKVDCEACHGPASEYKAIHNKKDKAEDAKKAGFIAKPDKASCTAKCHAKDFKDDMMAKVHAHKAK